jgi:uncharacterized RDD family membrane protein YckC
MQQLLTRESYIVDYAGFWLRLAAMTIDGLILWGINYLITGLWNLASGIPWSGITDQLVQEGITTVPLWQVRALTFFVILVMYFIAFWAWRGQTPGKMALRIKVVRFNGEPIGWGGASLRFCGYIISTIIIFIGFFWVAFDGRRQGIHDKIAETFVIRIPTGKQLKQWQAPTGQVQVY